MDTNYCIYMSNLQHTSNLPCTPAFFQNFCTWLYLPAVLNDAVDQRCCPLRVIDVIFQLQRAPSAHAQQITYIYYMIVSRSYRSELAVEFADPAPEPSDPRQVDLVFRAYRFRDSVQLTAFWHLQYILDAERTYLICPPYLHTAWFPPLSTL